MPLRAADIMESVVVAIGPDRSLAELEDLLIARRVSGVPVVDKGRVVGIVSRSDIVRSLSLTRALTGLIADGLRPSEFGPAEASAEPAGLTTALAEQLRARTVQDAMVTDLVVVRPDATLAEVARLLVERHLHRVLVTEGSTLLGVISSLDIVRLVADGRLNDQ
jgi:CBS domain-containing protein